MNRLPNQRNMNCNKRKIKPNFVKASENIKESLKTCGMLLINTMMIITLQQQGSNRKLGEYMDEMLHSIFFLGYIHKDRLTPNDFISTSTIEKLRNKFPEPFKRYSKDLPTRTPFSILLDMMEILYSTENIKKELLHLLKKLNFPNPLQSPGSKTEQYYTLESTVICVCSHLDSHKYYGASICCRKGVAKIILIDLSCLKTWHEYVSHAVMSFTESADSGEGITFPESLQCQAYFRDWNRNEYKEKSPCSNCGKLFNLKNADPQKADHPYGNCAETECLSKLLMISPYLHENAVIENHTEERLEKLKNLTKARLIKNLRTVDITVTNDKFDFYTPSQMVVSDCCRSTPCF
ncbi:uncharacterized protein [Hoplias malabaricus]|uniref:uncharacterized protein n=1 Tax=Hoplias malabaricus TaxID=27720 RepID=UPI003462A26F